MLNMIKNWRGTVEINGTTYDNMQAAVSDFKAVSGTICIKLHPAKENGCMRTVPPLQDEKTLTEQTTVKTGEIKITVKPYMTRKATPEFDFMKKFNDDNPMPMRIMQGTIEKETRGMYFMKLHGLAQATIRCTCCGKELTNPVSRHYGIGPICLGKLGITRDIEDIENIKNDLVNVVWEGWVIKSAITEREEV